MKRLFPVLCSMLLLTGCSYLSRRSPYDESPTETKSEATIENVPKTQFDQLALKYENLLKRNEELEDRLKSAAGAVDSKSIPATEAQTDISSEQLAQNIKEGTSGKEGFVETVDVFDKNKRPELKEADSFEAGAVSATNGTDNLDKDRFNDELSSLRKGQKLLAESKYDAALKIFKELESSNQGQIKVRAKFYIGELLFRQGEFDLAMQVYEEVISKEAFSGLVIKSLGRLIVCAQKLKLSEKQERYYSLLHDFFEES